MHANPGQTMTPTRAHIRHGIKTGTAALLAHGLTQVLGLPMGFWAVLSTVIVMQVHLADSIKLCLERFQGTALGAAIGLAALALLMGTAAPLWLGLFLSVAFCAYMTRYDERYRMAAITVVVLLGAQGEEHPLLFGLYRVLEIGVGVLCAFVVSVLLWPRRAGTALKEHLEGQFLQCAERFATLAEAFMSRQQPLPEDFLADLDQAVGQNRQLLHKAMQHERLLYDKNLPRITAQVELLERCLEHMHAMLGAVNTALGEGFTLIMERELRELAEACAGLLRELGAGRIPEEDPLRQALKQVELRLQELRESGVTMRFHLRKMLQVMAFINSLETFTEDLLRGRRRLAREGAGSPPMAKGTAT